MIFNLQQRLFTLR